MTEQEILILSFFDRHIPREMTDKDISAKMVVAGIGKNTGSAYQYYELVHQLVQKNLLAYYDDPNQKGVRVARGEQLFVLTELGEMILKAPRF